MTNEEARAHMDMLIAHKDKALETHPYFNRCDSCIHSEEQDGSNCYECVKGMADNFEAQPTGMRDATEEERKSVKDYIESISKPTGFNFYKAQSSKDCVSRIDVKEQMFKYGFNAPDMTVTEFVEDCLPSVKPQQPRWILVTERLPELGEVVLIYDKEFGYLTAIYSEVIDDYDERIPCFSTHYSISSDKWAIMHPIAWMPFELFKEVTTDDE